MIAALLLAAALPAAAAPSTLTVDCDPRLDLLGVVQTLAGWRLSEPPLPRSMADLETRFAAWKDHPAVKTYAATAARLDGHETFVLILTALSDPPELAWVAPRRALSVEFVAKAGGDAAVDAFLRDLRDFARRSGAMEWLKSRSGECREARAAARLELGGRDPLALLEGYLGRPLDARVRLTLPLVYTRRMYTHYIIPYPYSPDGPVKGPFRVSAVIKHDWGETGRPRFFLEAPFQSGVFQEVYYIVAEPAYLRHKKEFEARAHLAAGLGEGCHGVWQNCALHVVVQALNRRVAALDGRGLPEHGDDPVPAAIKRLAARLETDYEPGRAAGRYRDIDDFWPRLIDALGPPAPPRD
ncbi:MAG: hypothetical protein SF051_09095 [Elusimicrobiota bacterium]|nr:hypothetical protein [Elusimicrobiota bacterium]